MPKIIQTLSILGDHGEIKNTLPPGCYVYGFSNFGNFTIIGKKTTNEQGERCDLQGAINMDGDIIIPIKHENLEKLLDNYNTKIISVIDEKYVITSKIDKKNVITSKSEKFDIYDLEKMIVIESGIADISVARNKLKRYIKEKSDGEKEPDIK